MTKPTIRITQILWRDQYERLVAESKATGIAVVRIIRDSIDQSHPPTKKVKESRR